MMSESNDQAQIPSAATSPLFLIAVLLPMLGYLGSIGFAEAKRWGAPTIQVAIEGYDPRDLVRGHYLNYQIALDPNAVSIGEGPEQKSRYSFRRACATSSKGGLSGVVLFNEETPTNCTAALPVDFIQEQHRFFIQQDQAAEIERAVQEERATVVLRLISERSVTADQLLIDGKVFGSR